MKYRKTLLIVGTIVVGLVVITFGVVAFRPVSSARAEQSALGQGVRLDSVKENRIEAQKSAIQVEPTESITQTEAMTPTETATQTEVMTEPEMITQTEAMTQPETMTQSDFDETTFVMALSVRPELFVDCVDNPYFPLIPGTTYEYRVETDEGTEMTTVTVTTQTKEIMGISATVVRDTVELNGEVKEDTFDWYAQDDRGNVWYLGEETKEYENGEVVTTSGSFEAGVDGARAGIIMEGDPRPGDVYREEYYPDRATDMGAVLSLTEPVSVTIGSFENALMTAAYNPLDSELEHKFYVPGVGVVKEALVGGNETSELVSISHDSNQMQDSNAPAACGAAFVGTIPVGQNQQNLESLAQITAAQAEEAALAVNPDSQVQETELEVENGFLAYEVALDNGSEVLVDAGDGTILSIETAETADEVGEEEDDDTDPDDDEDEAQENN